jgi:nucleoside phosphorylase
MNTREPVDLAVITALPEELRGLWRAFPGLTPSRPLADDSHHAGNPFMPGDLRVGALPDGRSVVSTATGAGTLAAATACTWLFMSYAPRRVIAAGIGGAVADSVGLGDLVVCTRTQFYDVDATPLGISLGTLERGRGAVMALDSSEHHTRSLALAKEAVERAVRGGALSQARRVHSGLVAGGDTLLTRRTLAALPEDWREVIYDAQAVDMETPTWAACALSAGITPLIVRLISDHVVRSERIGFVRACDELGAVLRELVLVSV